jgi:hypothetical protein
VKSNCAKKGIKTMEHKMKYQESVLLVGLGAIACAYDYAAKLEIKNGISTTHLSAATHAGLQIIGGIDPDKKARSEFEKHSKLPSWKNLKDLPPYTHVDIAVVSSPPNTHRKVIEQILEVLDPRAIICEKPFGNSGKDSKAILAMLSKRKIPLLINYTREFSGARRELDKHIDSHEFVSGFFTYSHGLRRSCSHFIRLIIGLIGEPLEINKIEKGKSANNPSFKLTYPGDRHFYFIGLDFIEFRIASGQIEFNDRILEIQEGGRITIHKAPKDKLAPFWPSEGKLIAELELNGGIDLIYEDLSWMMDTQTKAQASRNQLDHSCNIIMDKVIF